MSLRILLADDHRMIREGLQSLLEGQKDVTVVGTAENGREAVAMAEELLPDVVVMDVTMPDLNGIEATRRLCQSNPYVKVIALSMHADRQYVMRMLEAGAAGYLLKDCAFEELQSALETVMADRTYLSPSIADVVVDAYVRYRSGSMAPSPQLTPREREVLQLVAEGKSTKNIARLLNVSIKTIETHRRNIGQKLGISSVAELTKHAIREGLTSLEG